MRMYFENTVQLEEVLRDILEVFRFELSNCKYIKLELRANVGGNKHELDDIWNKVLCQLKGDTVVKSTCEKCYTDESIKNEDCYYAIWVYQ